MLVSNSQSKRVHFLLEARSTDDLVALEQEWMRKSGEKADELRVIRAILSRRLFGNEEKR